MVAVILSSAYATSDGGEQEPCPFCGSEAVEFDGIMNYSTFFADAYCPDCRVRFEFQKAKKGKVESNNLKKAKKAFGRRDNGR